MPTINPKPFSVSERLYKTKFLGKPAVFAAEDINRWMDALVWSRDKLFSAVGAVRENFTVTADTLTVTTDAGPPAEVTFGFNWSLDKVSGGSPAYVFYNGVAYNVPEGSGSASLTQPNSGSSSLLLGAYLFLVATKKTVSFNDSPPVLHVADPKAFSGITGDSFPEEIPSSDNVVYGGERLEVALSAGDISLSADEEVICILATFKHQVLYPTTENSLYLPGGPIPGEAFLSVMHNAISPADLSDTFRYVKLSGFAQVSSKAFSHNGGLADLVSLLTEQYKFGQSLQDSRIFNQEVYRESHESRLVALEGTSGSLVPYLSGGWETADGNEPRYEIVNGYVRFHGALTSGFTNNNLFSSIPANIIPTAHRYSMALATGMTTAEESVYQISINSGGWVVISHPDGSEREFDNAFKKVFLNTVEYRL